MDVVEKVKIVLLDTFTKKEKVDFIERVRVPHHSAFKQAYMELENYNTSETIDFEFKSAIVQAVRNKLI